MADLPIPGRGVPMPRPRPNMDDQFIGEMGPEMGTMDQVPQGFDDPNSTIAELLRRMQGTAEQSRVPAEMEAQFQNQLGPSGPIDTIRNANRPVGTGPGMSTHMGTDSALTPEELIELLLRQEGPRRIGGYSDR